MAKRLVMDAMIRRADFWQKDTLPGSTNIASASPLASITFENLRTNSAFVLSLRKPDFQRETNQWSAGQAVTFIQSFLDGDLVPSVILWQSQEGYIFAIDGAHRLSALRAWVEDDYGDGPTSIAFFAGEIPEEQKKIAKSMRTMIEKSVGSYQSLQAKLLARNSNPTIEYDTLTNKRLRHLGARQLDLQWVNGDADIAETSFFKINTQGTPLDKTEEELLRNRNRPPAIAARSIVRAATGHKYWSKFSEEARASIEKLAEEANLLIFHPELTSPVRSVQLPLGGTSSNLDALSLLIRLLAITNGNQKNRKPAISTFDNDSDGSETISNLKKCIAVLKRMSGNSGESLGLHPAVYFYSDRGKYLPDFFLGMAYCVKGKIINNNDQFFKDFTNSREKLEKFLVENKALITQILQQISSRVRVERVSEIIEYMVKNGQSISIEGVAAAARLKGSIVDLREKVEGKNFNDAAKSAIIIRQSLTTAMKCPLCSGYMDPALSVSFDHIVRQQDGGTGDCENGQLTHPYCNTGFKC